MALESLQSSTEKYEFRASTDSGWFESPIPLRLRRYGIDPIELTQLLPVIESFGLIVVEAIPYRFNTPPASMVGFR